MDLQPKQPTRIFAPDILLADFVIDLKENDPLLKLLAKHEMKPGGKKRVTWDVFRDEFAGVVEGKPITIYPGGSAANTLWTMGKILGEDVSTTFFSVLGQGLYSTIIDRSMKSAGIRVVPENISSKLDDQGRPMIPTTAISYVFRYPNSERTIVTWPGNAKEFLKPDMVEDAMIANTDKVFMQGGFWEKFDPKVADRIMQLRHHHGKELWLALPTSAFFAKERSEHFKFVAPSATVILSNEDELGYIFNTSPAEAVKRLRAEFQKEHADVRGVGERVGFITRGKDGAYIVTAGGIEPIDPPNVRQEDIKNTLGAGDNSFAGFLTGRILGLSHKECGKLAMDLAGKKITTSNGARLEDPRATFEEIRPRISKQLGASVGDDPVLRAAEPRTRA
jgi:sugar/nucleoside kinase (ribokinase family)